MVDHHQWLLQRLVSENDFDEHFIYLYSYPLAFFMLSFTLFCSFLLKSRCRFISFKATISKDNKNSGYNKLIILAHCVNRIAIYRYVYTQLQRDQSASAHHTQQQSCVEMNRAGSQMVVSVKKTSSHHMSQDIRQRMDRIIGDWAHRRSTLPTIPSVTAVDTNIQRSSLPGRRGRMFESLY